MTNQPLLRATGPDDLLALVPTIFGFHPEKSIVVITVGDAQVPMHARVDLPEDLEESAELASYLTSVALQNGISRLAVVVYSGSASLGRCVIEDMDDHLERAGVDLVCAIRADAGCWWLLDGRFDDDRPGTPYDVSSHRLMAEAVLAGSVVLGSRAELAATLVGTDPDEIAEVGRLSHEALDRLALLPDGLVTEGRWVRHRVVRYLEDGSRLDRHDVARLAALMTVSIQVRDVAWAEMSHVDAAQHVELWRDVVRRVPAELRAAPAALLGFAAWLTGHGALAWCAVECAQRADPTYSLTTLLSSALERAVPPSTWKPIPRESLALFRH